MNPLGPLPVSNSKQFTLDGIDAKKIGRFLLVQTIGLGLTFVPVLMGYSYAYHGMDFTPIVTVLIGSAAEAGRRFVAGEPKD